MINRILNGLANETLLEGGAKMRVIASADNWMETAATDQLRKVMELPGVQLGVGMPDLHPGRGQPIGAAVVSTDIVYPQLVGSDIGCGIGLWQLDVASRKVRPEKWGRKLINMDAPWSGDVSQWLQDRGYVFNGLDRHSQQLGTIGGGNHFAEIQGVHEIFDERAFQDLGLGKTSIVMVAHSGSRGIGQALLQAHVQGHGAAGLQGEDAISYVRQHDLAERWAVANRELIVHRFEEVLGFRARRLLDICHNHVRPVPSRYARDMGIENAKGASSVWIHRKGVTPANEGLVVIPGSRGALTYLVRPIKESHSTLSLAGMSLAHGAGRKWKRSDCRRRLEKKYRVQDLEQTAFGSRVICKKKELLYEEAPQAYKDINVVVADMQQAGLIELVASLRPILTYKTMRK